MHHKSPLTLTSISILFAVWSGGCVPSPDAAPASAAARLCDTAVACDWIARSDYEECSEDNEGAFGLLWNEDSCPDGIDGPEWRDCLEAIETLDCGSILFGWTNFGAACSTAQVCL